jgi:hypothetical protein
LDIGRRVIYLAHKHGKCERGVITSFNDRYVFVRYDDQMPDTYGKATRRENLAFEYEEIK